MKEAFLNSLSVWKLSSRKHAHEAQLRDYSAQMPQRGSVTSFRALTVVTSQAPLAYFPQDFASRVHGTRQKDVDSF